MLRLIPLLFFTTIALAETPQIDVNPYAECSTPLQTHQKCWSTIGELSPTQFCVGYQQVEKKAKKLDKLRHKNKYQAYLESHPVPVVIAPSAISNRPFFMVDHHHLTRAIYELDHDLRSPVLIEVVDNFKNEPHFWKRMLEHKPQSYVYLKDENGHPRSINELLKTRPQIHYLTDDPFRSLAGEVKDEGG